MILRPPRGAFNRTGNPGRKAVREHSCAAFRPRHWLLRRRSTSRTGGAPNIRLYSRLNWEGLS